MDSVTSGVKFLALYERDINLLVTHGARGVVVIDDVVTTGGTIMGLVDLLDQVAQLKKLPHPFPFRPFSVWLKKGSGLASSRPLSIPLPDCQIL